MRSVHKLLSFSVLVWGLLQSAVAWAGADDEAVARQLEAFRSAQVAANAGTLTALSAPELTYSHSDGRVEDRATFEVHRQFTAQFDQATMCHVTTGHKGTGQVHHVADIQSFKVLVLDGGGQNFFHSLNPLCEITS